MGDPLEHEFHNVAVDLSVHPCMVRRRAGAKVGLHVTVQRLWGTEVRPPGLELSYDTGPPGTGCSIASTTSFSGAASPCCGGAGACTAAFFATVRFAFVLITRFLGAVLAATRLAVRVRAARLAGLLRFSVALRAASGFFR